MPSTSHANKKMSVPPRIVPPHATEAFRPERNATPDRLTPDTQKGYRDMHISSAVRPWIVTAARGGIGHHVGVWTGDTLVQFLDYLVSGLLLSCAAAIGWTVFFGPA